MDPSIIPALAAVISAAVGGAAGEAGKSAWATLTALVRRRFGDDTPAELEAQAAHDPREIAGILISRAQGDPEFGTALAEWMAHTARTIRPGGVTNVIGDNAEITGTVVQAGDVHGSINLRGRR
ncbi:hypothetical protein [Spongiactinospora sp. TRM90649]|uniref:hypothetical protein n=1 Tax=Spongiactinospora sp. TRM90649 TaxID=3031114 RepID=UPI0023F8BCC8|nr:hypothetical protein [Spongiactinospora sp. TRM90649]MDF5754482.1 hypothetical protein [Spongiactinospora sp. TRM90649]